MRQIGLAKLDLFGELRALEPQRFRLAVHQISQSVAIRVCLSQLDERIDCRKHGIRRLKC